MALRVRRPGRPRGATARWRAEPPSRGCGHRTTGRPAANTDSGPDPLGGQVSASSTAAPARTSFGRIPSALAALALVVVLAVSVALRGVHRTTLHAPDLYW